MAYRYPPPSFAKLNEQNAPIFTPVMNFNIPPPGYGTSRSIEGSTGDVRYEHYPPISSKEEINKDAIRYCPPVCSEDKSKQIIHFGHCPPQQQFQQSSEIFNNCPMKSIEVTQQESVFSQTHSVLEQKVHLKNRRVKKKTSQTLKIYEAKALLQSSMKDLEELQGLQNSLKLDYQNLNPASWKETWGHIMNLMVQIDTSLKKLKNPSSVEILKKLLIMRTKKRKREKRKCAEHREVKVESFRRRQHLHEHINNWLKDMEDVVEKAKREESLKLEADQVLSEVTRRTTEARKQLNMLKALQKLRLIRAQTLSNQGQRVNTDSGIRFNRVIEHLKKLWEDQLKGYELEEQGLRLMLEEAVEERNKSELVQIKQTLMQWEELLFGKRGPVNEFYQAAERDEEAFITTRKSWDQFLAPPGAVMSSSIPIGWIIPENPSSSEWEAFQSKK